MGSLDADHTGHTEIRFSINSRYVVRNFEKAVAGLERRLIAARKVANAGYPLGFLIGPIMVYDGWQDEYVAMLQELAAQLEGTTPPSLTFKLITHRFTRKAKRVIDEVYPTNALPMEEEERRWKWGQFGYGKFLYPKDTYAAIEDFFHSHIEQLIPQAKILYLV